MGICESLVCEVSVEVEVTVTFVHLSMTLPDDDNLLHLNAAYADRRGHDRRSLSVLSRQTSVSAE